MKSTEHTGMFVVLQENGRIVITPDRTGTLTLTINGLEARDTSNYTCIATNAGGSTTANGTIIVECKC